MSTLIEIQNQIRELQAQLQTTINDNVVDIIEEPRSSIVTTSIPTLSGRQTPWESNPLQQSMDRLSATDAIVASGLDYPEKGKPIGVFIQIATRMFLYHLFMPKDKGHEKLAIWSKRNWKGKKENIKRITTSVKKIKKILDKTVFKKYATK